MFSDELEARARQRRPPGITDEDLDVRRKAAIEEGGDAVGEFGIIEKIAGEDDVGARCVARENVGACRRDGDVVCGGVELGCRDRIGIGIDGGDVAGARFGRGDANEARAAAKIDDDTVRDCIGMIENVARKREAAAPVLRPVRRFTIFVGLRETPKAAAWAGLMRTDFGNGRNRRERQVLFDKVGNFRDGARSRLARSYRRGAR